MGGGKIHDDVAVQSTAGRYADGEGIGREDALWASWARYVECAAACVRERKEDRVVVTGKLGPLSKTSEVGAIDYACGGNSLRRQKPQAALDG